MKNKTSFKGEKGREGETKKYIKKGRKKERKKEEGQREIQGTRGSRERERERERQGTRGSREMAERDKGWGWVENKIGNFFLPQQWVYLSTGGQNS